MFLGLTFFKPPNLWRLLFFNYTTDFQHNWESSPTYRLSTFPASLLQYMLQGAYRVLTHFFTTDWLLLNTSKSFPSRLSRNSCCKMDAVSSELLDYHNDYSMEVVYCSLQCCAINCGCISVPVWTRNCRLHCLLWPCFLVSSCIKLYAAGIINENCRAMHHHRTKMGEWVCNGL